MYRLRLAFLPLGFLVAVQAGARGEEAPGAVIEKAIKAQYGAAATTMPAAIKMKIKGVFHEEQLGDISFTGETATQYPDQFRHTLDVGAGIGTLIEVLNKNRGWFRDNESVNEADAPGLQEMQNSAYVDYLTTLFPLLLGKGLTLSNLEESKVAGKAAVGIKVESAGKPDVSLYFDKESGLLVKTRYAGRDAHTKKTTVKEQTFHDYREVIPAGTEQDALKNAKLPAQDTALLDFLRKRTLTDAELGELDALVHKLGDSSFEVRSKAKQDLVAQGAKALPALTQAAKDTDPEVRDAAKECLERIGKGSENEEIAAVIRQMARRQTKGAVEILLAYVPSAPDEKIAQEVRGALAAVGNPKGQPDKALTQALEDKNPLRRAAAKAALQGDGKKVATGAGTPVLLFGFKMPMKGEEYNAGKKVWECEATDIQFFDHLEDAIFGKP